MKNFIKLIQDIVSKEKIDFSVFCNDNLVFSSGETLQQKDNSCLTTLFNGEKLKVIISGKGEKQKLLLSFIKSYISIGQELPIKNKNSFFVKVLSNQNVKNSEYYEKYSRLKNRILITIYSKEESEQLLSFLQEYCSKGDILVKIDNNIVVIILDFENLNEFSSGTEYCKILFEALREEFGNYLFFGISEKCDFSTLSVAFENSKIAVNFGKKYFLGNIFSYAEMLPYILLEKLPILERQSLLKNYYCVFDNSELLYTANTFLQNDLNVNLTSEKLFIHRNTTMYRLNKIEKLTGLNLKSFSDSLTFRILYSLYLMEKNKNGK